MKTFGRLLRSLIIAYILISSINYNPEMNEVRLALDERNLIVFSLMALSFYLVYAFHERRKQE